MTAIQDRYTELAALAATADTNAANLAASVIAIRAKEDEIAKLVSAAKPGNSGIRFIGLGDYVFTRAHRLADGATTSTVALMASNSWAHFS